MLITVACFNSFARVNIAQDFPPVLIKATVSSPAKPSACDNFIVFNYLIVCASFQLVSEATGEKKVVKKRKPAEEKPTQKTEAEKRIESIRSEVEKVLDKLGQMEIET